VVRGVAGGLTFRVVGVRTGVRRSSFGVVLGRAGTTVVGRRSTVVRAGVRVSWTGRRVTGVSVRRAGVSGLAVGACRRSVVLGSVAGRLVVAGVSGR
jgi:hypothetical protein